MNNQLRQQFPFFADAHQVTYLDNAATTQKPECVLATMQAFWLAENANVHRSSHQLSTQATNKFEAARQTLADFLGANSSKEIVWTKGATESINLVAQVLSDKHFTSGKSILLSYLEHHANIVPWQQVAKRLNMHIRVMPVDDAGVLQLDESLALLDESIALVAVGHVSNAMGNINPIEKLIEKARQVGALSLIDGAQAVAHLPVDVQALACDFYVFSGHKTYAPTGIGVLYGRQALLEQLPPYQTGGEMIQTVSFTGTTFQSLPHRFEAGTPNVAGVIGLAEAIDFIARYRDEIYAAEQDNFEYLIAKMQELSEIKFWGDLKNTTATQSFQLEGVDNQDVGILLNEQNIAIRVGHHCAMPLMQRLGVQGTCRVSMACYNDASDVDKFIRALKQVLVSANNKNLCIAGSNKSIEIPDNSALGPIAQKVSCAKGWDNIYREIMLAGKQLRRLNENQKQSDNEVYGCESQVWLVCEPNNSGLDIAADSPSKIVRGLLAILIEALEKRNCQQILEYDMHSYLSKIALNKHLSASRGNGLAAVMQQIKISAKQFS